MQRNPGASGAEVCVVAPRKRIAKPKHAPSHCRVQVISLENPVILALWEIIDSLDAQRVDYVVMGGLAVRALAIPRPTNDVDLTILCSREKLSGLLSNWQSKSIQVPEIYLTGWLDRVADMPLVKLKTQISPEHSVDLDIFLCETEFQRSLISRRIQAEIDDQRSIWIVSPEDLVLLKLIANRPRDLIDVADVLFVQGQLDEAYMKHWADRLGIPERLQNALQNIP
jgi:hypothetical protein